MLLFFLNVIIWFMHQLDWFLLWFFHTNYYDNMHQFINCEYEISDLDKRMVKLSDRDKITESWQGLISIKESTWISDSNRWYFTIKKHDS